MLSDYALEKFPVSVSWDQPLPLSSSFLTTPSWIDFLGTAAESWAFSPRRQKDRTASVLPFLCSTSTAPGTPCWRSQCGRTWVHGNSSRCFTSLWATLYARYYQQPRILLEKLKHRKLSNWPKATKWTLVGARSDLRQPDPTHQPGSGQSLCASGLPCGWEGAQPGPQLCHYSCCYSSETSCLHQGIRIFTLKDCCGD